MEDLETWLNQHDEIFWESYGSAKALYEYEIKNNPEYKGSVIERWILNRMKELNLREIAKELKL